MRTSGKKRLKQLVNSLSDSERQRFSALFRMPHLEQSAPALPDQPASATTWEGTCGGGRTRIRFDGPSSEVEGLVGILRANNCVDEVAVP